MKVNLTEDSNINKRKGRPIPIHLQDQVAEELRRPRKGNRDKPSSNNSKER